MAKAKTKRTTKPKTPRVQPYDTNAWIALFHKLGIMIAEDDGRLYLAYDESRADETAVEAFLKFYRQAPREIAAHLKNAIEAREMVHWRRYLDEPRQRCVSALAPPEKRS